MNDFIAYPKIANVGTRGYEELFYLPLWASEKLDGSNVSIHVLPGQRECPMDDLKEIKLASRTKWLDWQSKGDSKMFRPFIEWTSIPGVAEVLMSFPVGTTFWGEMCVNQNIIKYPEKIPFVLFDISYDDEFGSRRFIRPDQWERYTVENNTYPIFVNIPTIVPTQILSSTLDKTKLDRLIADESMLGGPREGIVLKNYDRDVTVGGRLVPFFCKYVAPAYRETKKIVDRITDPLESRIANSVFTPMRFEKGIQKLKEEGRYTGSVQDIGPLIGVICEDIHVECRAEIEVALFTHFWKPISRIITSKIPGMYKDKLETGIYTSPEAIDGTTR